MEIIVPTSVCACEECSPSTMPGTEQGLVNGSSSDEKETEANPLHSPAMNLLCQGSGGSLYTTAGSPL